MYHSFKWRKDNFFYLIKNEQLLRYLCIKWIINRLFYNTLFTIVPNHLSIKYLNDKRVLLYNCLTVEIDFYARLRKHS